MVMWTLVPMCNSVHLTCILHTCNVALVASLYYKFIFIETGVFTD